MATNPNNQLVAGLRLNLMRNVQSAVARGAKGVNDELVAFARASDLGDKDDVAVEHQAVARHMQDAVISAYDTEVESRKGVSYPRESRLSGRIRKAIANDAHYEADGDSIAFINGPLLSKEAAHWKRLNFGADPAANEPAGSRRRPLRLFGRSLYDVGFRIKPQPAFILPEGFFNDGDKMSIPKSEFRGSSTGRPFYVSKKSPYKPAVTSGIVGRHFLEAGIDVLAEELPVRYENLMRKWLTEGGDRRNVITNTVGKGSSYRA